MNFDVLPLGPGFRQEHLGELHHTLENIHAGRFKGTDYFSAHTDGPNRLDVGETAHAQVIDSHLGDDVGEARSVCHASQSAIAK